VGTRSTLITRHLPVTAHFTCLDHPTLANAMLDREVGNSHQIELDGHAPPDKKKEKFVSGGFAGAWPR